MKKSKPKTKKKTVIIICLLAAFAAAAAAAVLFAVNSAEKTEKRPAETAGVSDTVVHASEQTTERTPETVSETGATADVTVPESVTPPVTEPAPAHTLPEVKETSYERRLAAAAVTAVAMESESDDRKVEAVFLTGETPMNEYLESGGIYILFRENGILRAVHCEPLLKERTEPGTTDLTSSDLGWATFDYTEELDPVGYIELSIDELSEEIGQAMLVTLSRH